MNIMQMRRGMGASGEKEIQCVSTLGVAYFDTLIPLAAISYIYIKGSFAEVADNQYNGARGLPTYANIGMRNNRFLFQFGGAGTELLTTTADTDVHEFFLDATLRKCGVDENEFPLSKGTASTSQVKFFLFCRNDGSDVPQYNFPGDIYRATFYGNVGQRIGDFVPAIVNGVVGFYDEVTQTFRGSANSTPFTYK